MSDKQQPSLASALKIVATAWKRCAVDSSEEYWSAPVPTTATRCTTSVALWHNTERGVIRIEITADVTGFHNERPIGTSGSFKVMFDFLLENMNDFFSGDNLDPFTASTIVGIAYSTMRGMVLERTAGTVLNGVILPVANPSQLINVPMPPEADSLTR